MYRALRRHYNVKKAVRKQKIAKAVTGSDWYDNLHQYSDNKIHCSCPMCAFSGRTAQDMRNEAKMDARIKDFASKYFVA